MGPLVVILLLHFNATFTDITNFSTVIIKFIISPGGNAVYKTRNNEIEFEPETAAGVQQQQTPPRLSSSGEYGSNAKAPEAPATTVYAKKLYFRIFAYLGRSYTPERKTTGTQV